MHPDVDLFDEIILRSERILKDMGKLDDGNYSKGKEKIEQIKELLEALKELDSDNEISLRVITDIEEIVDTL